MQWFFLFFIYYYYYYYFWIFILKGLIVGRFQWKEAWRSVTGDAALLAWKERERFVEEYFPTHPINTTFVNPGFHSISLHRGIVFFGIFVPILPFVPIFKAIILLFISIAIIIMCCQIAWSDHSPPFTLLPNANGQIWLEKVFS